MLFFCKLHLTYQKYVHVFWRRFVKDTIINWMGGSSILFIKCLLGRLIIPRAMRVDKRALALRDIV